VLGKMLGVPLFQEQAMQVAMVAAGFSPSEADQLRRAMATFKFTGGVDKFRDKLIRGMLDNGYAQEYAERTFRQIEGLGSYGFPESHAASFALVAYASSWMKCHHPDVFLCAILNAQPMGFYAPAQLVRDAREHGVEVRGRYQSLAVRMHAGRNGRAASCGTPWAWHGARPGREARQADRSRAG
jgi:error-prone DNA polymerase